MNKLILLIGTIGIAAPAFAYDNDYDFMRNNSVAQELNRTAERQEEQRQTYNYQPCYSPDINQPITQNQYPGALDPQRNLPAWSYNP